MIACFFALKDYKFKTAKREDNIKMVYVYLSMVAYHKMKKYLQYEKHTEIDKITKKRVTSKKIFVSLDTIGDIPTYDREYKDAGLNESTIKNIRYIFRDSGDELKAIIGILEHYIREYNIFDRSDFIDYAMSCGCSKQTLYMFFHKLKVNRKIFSQNEESVSVQETNPDGPYTIRQVMGILNMSKKMVLNRIRNGILKAQKINRIYSITKDNINEYNKYCDKHGIYHYSVKQVMEILNVTNWCVKMYIKSGKLNACKINNKIFIAENKFFNNIRSKNTHE
jgi:hypothetical protein